MQYQSARFETPDRWLHRSVDRLHFCHGGKPLEYHLPHECSPPIEVVLGSVDLVRDRTIRCNPDCRIHARGRHAPRMAAVICDYASCVASLGLGDATGSAARTPISPLSPVAFLGLVRTSRGFHRDQSDFRRLEHLAGEVAEPLSTSSATRTVCVNTVRQVLQRHSLRVDSVRVYSCHQLCAGFARAPGSSADRDGAP